MESCLFHGMNRCDEGQFITYDVDCYSATKTLQRPLDDDFYDSDVDTYSHTVQRSFDEDFYNYDVDYSPVEAFSFSYYHDNYCRAHTLQGPLGPIFYDYDVDYSPAHALERPCQEDSLDYLQWQLDEDSLYYEAYYSRAHSLEWNTSTGSVHPNPNSNSVSTSLFTAGASKGLLDEVDELDVDSFYYDALLLARARTVHRNPDSSSVFTLLTAGACHASQSPGMDLTAPAVVTQGENSTSGNLDKLEENLNSIHISSCSNIRIDETQEPVAILNTAEISTEGEQDYSSGISQPVRGCDHDDMADDWEFIQKGEIDRAA